jgi:hypothetical protein
VNADILYMFKSDMVVVCGVRAGFHGQPTTQEGGFNAE